MRFRERLENYEVELAKEIRKVEAWLEDPTEQIPLLDTEHPGTQELDRQTQQKQDELLRHKENLSQVQDAIEAISREKTPPFVWDIAFVEIFHQRGGFDIVIENPPYIRQERIAPPTIPREQVTLENRREYKAKLMRTVYQTYPDHFGYNENQDTVRHTINAKSDLYIYFYFHGLSLLNPKGTFCTITSNSWLDVGYGKNLQEFLLKRCHFKMVLDNSARRSFASADVNTVICLISAPDKTSENSGLQHGTCFVNFTVPFEAVLDPIIFYEIETAEGRERTPEHRIHQISQRELLQQAMREQKYVGDKWGGKYLRAPDIYWHIIEHYQDKLVRVEEVAEVRMGLKTGANEFFVIDKETIATWQIEDEFLHPIISSPRDTRHLLVKSEQLPYQLFMCHESKNTLQGTSALAYIEYGESQDIHQRPSCRTRPRWYDVGQRPIPHLNFPLVIGSTVRTLYTTDRCYATNNFAEIHPPVNLRVSFCYSLNSTLLQLMVNINGRSNFGGGVLGIAIYELENLLCVNPNLLEIIERGGVHLVIFSRQKTGMC